jgi:hypothetical protein
MSVIVMWSSHPTGIRELSLLHASRMAVIPSNLLFSGYKGLCPRGYSGWGMRLIIHKVKIWLK